MIARAIAGIVEFCKRPTRKHASLGSDKNLSDKSSEGYQQTCHVDSILNSQVEPID